MPFAGQFIDFKTVMVRQLPFISCSCLLQSLAYAIGVAEPVMIEVDTFDTGEVCADDCLAAAIPLVFGVTPVQIMESLRLNRPIFRQTAVFGHFGRKEFPWERTAKVLALQDTIL